MSIADEIKAIEATLVRLNGQQKSERSVKWQPKGGYLQIDCGGDVVSVNSFSHQKEFGTKRITREQAQCAAVEMRRFNRLLALRDELCGDEVVDWGDHRYKHYVYFSHSDRQWRAEFNDDYESITPYFTSKESAQKACDMLNSGEVEL